MSDSEQEEAFWTGHAKTGAEGAKASIAADESAWTGAVLQANLDMIVPAIDVVVRRDADARVLDLGCGVGRLTIPLAALFQGVLFIGVDISSSMLMHAITRQMESAQQGSIRWIPCDGRTLPIDTASLTAAYSMITLQHIPRSGIASYLHEVARCLKEGGVFRFQVLEGTAASFLWNEVDEDWLLEHCNAADLFVAALDRTKPTTADEARVLWVTAIKQG